MTETDATEPTGAAPRERVIELSVEVAGSPEEVWQAIATGPGITSWYVPTTVEEHVGGATTSRFGEGPEMLIPGVVTAWDPPHRIVFAGHDSAPGMAFEWLVEARNHGTCVVRLVNSGFIEGSPWDDQYDGMVEGWTLFLANLQLHQAHFPGRNATSMLPTAAWPLSQAAAWSRLTVGLGLPKVPADGDRIQVSADDAPPLAGTVTGFRPGRLTVLLDEPAPGTAFLAAEAMGEGCGVSVWQYLYGADAAEIVARDEPRWTAWLQAHAAEVRTE